ncbi:hypothetical protein SLEP1_g35981 [Rubroshorea leprosula]|uniref:Pentatricopeptide repeat-containing protein n=1 Tax=Rubroshorea leprosula TaxID=152421 RepID=A0AAV5KQ33_9ROSI|nr:hypothetical protein SLEP1_g35981 [Rubroshorea leprosula]
MNIVSTKALLNQSIQSLCHKGKLQEAIKLLLSAPKSHSLPSFYMQILQLCLETKAQKQARLIHSHIITNGFASNLHLANKLIIFHVRVGDIVSSRKLFDKLPERNVVTWTAMISGYSQSGYYENALLMFSGMCRAGVKPNQFTYGSALRACTGLRSLERGLQIHGFIEKVRFSRNLFVLSALLDLHAKCGKVTDACYLFEIMTERDLVSWNVMIGGFSVQGFADDSFRLFKEMMGEGEIPDCFTLGSILRVCAGSSSLIKVCQVHGQIIQLGFELNHVLTGSLVDAYAKCGSLTCASQVYKSMNRKDVISCTALITGYAREGKCHGDALDLFKEILSMQIGMDNIILCSMLNICANMAQLNLGRQIHALALKCPSSNDVAMGNALIDMYAKSGEIKDANKVFSEMNEKNVISWTSLIAGYGKHGYGHEAIALFKKMECEGFKPNDITFLSLLFACSHSGLFGEGSELFNNMVSKYKILPRTEHFSCMVDLFARGGQFEAAYNLIQEMNIKPTASLWGALLGACSIHCNVTLGEVAASHLFDMDPKKSANYVALASTYAAAGAWENAGEIRKLMRESKAVKNPGYSSLSSAEKIVLLQPC